jgi:hypothetical protein
LAGGLVLATHRDYIADIQTAFVFTPPFKYGAEAWIDEIIAYTVAKFISLID